MYPAEFGGKASALINVATKPAPTSFTAACSSSIATMSSTRPTTSSPPNDPCRRCGRISSAAPSADRWCRTAAFFFGSYEGPRMRRSLTRTFSVPSASRPGREFCRASAPICDPLDDPDDRGVHAVCRTTRFPPSRIDPIATAFLAARSAADVRRRSAEPDVRRGIDRDLDQFSIRARSSADDADQLLRAFQHVRRRRAPALRHERASGSARSRIRRGH